MDDFQQIHQKIQISVKESTQKTHMFFMYIKTVPDVAITTFYTSLNKDVNRKKK